MLEPRESDIPVLFLVLIVLPLVAYILLGKWSEATKKSDQITLLANLAAEEALKVEEMAVADVIPPVSSSKNEPQGCARCSAPARTRCSKCKSVRYCSGNCQIIHWRQIHKQECQPMENHKSSPRAISDDRFNHASGLFNENLNSQFFADRLKQNLKESATLDTMVHPSTGSSAFAAADCALFDNSQAPNLERTSHNSNRETRRRDNAPSKESSTDSSVYMATESPFSSVESKEDFMREKSRNGDYSVLEEETLNLNAGGIGVHRYEQEELRSAMFESNNNESIDEFETGITTEQGNVIRRATANCPSDEATQYKCSSEMKIKGSMKAKKMPYSLNTKCSKSPKLTLKSRKHLCCPELETKGRILDEPKVDGIRDTIASHESNGTASMGIMKMMGLRKSEKSAALTTLGDCGDKHKKIKMLFPYEDFVKIFQGEVFGIFPRGLLNCGNSCYANAVLQCLTSTKPLVIYLLCRSHSNSCCSKDWCLMCELEQHIMILRENGDPLSPSRILCHLQSLNCQMGNGSQEDAHEFLRLLISSMQSTCLEELGGERKVDPKLQETTFIQHTFGGRLQSKVKCLNCNHESERYENILDLTLEILGWVESLEDALTQFTSPEDLDGENMYRCGRCTEYVQARKQLSIHEAPNILTIVLKRFQEGRYGKINKCITFPELLDMIPFMTGTGDIPPLYMLYAVVVHLDTLNASFSGHYVSYVKDLQGNWFRIDDSEVQPVHVSRVMLEGAYILFYMRSSPRPLVAHTGIVMRHQFYDSSKFCAVETSKPSKSGHNRCSSQFVVSDHSPDSRREITTHFIDTSNGFLGRSTYRNILPVAETYAENISPEFSDATSNDWSLFTSSDEASFTTESTRDSFSTVDYGDAGNMDPILSIFNYSPNNFANSVCYRKFSNSRPLTRFFTESIQKPFLN